jgi:hypothetical protein
VQRFHEMITRPRGSSPAQDPFLLAILVHQMMHVVRTMIDVACVCGYKYSFEGDVAVSPRCGEYTSFTEPPLKKSINSA